MNQRKAKFLRKEMNKREFPTEADRRTSYREIKREYTRFGFLHSQNPNPVMDKQQRRLYRQLQRIKDANARRLAEAGT